jgi:hypothetical protein
MRAPITQAQSVGRKGTLTLLSAGVAENADDGRGKRHEDDETSGHPDSSG